MNSINATNLYRKSGVAQWRDLQFGPTSNQKLNDFCTSMLWLDEGEQKKPPVCRNPQDGRTDGIHKNPACPAFTP
jgi:hypothetical protein